MRSTPALRHAVCLLLLVAAPLACGATKHSATSRHPSYRGRVMCGYQGWFRADGDGSQRGWVHYGWDGKFDPQHVTIDYWPETSEYAKTYPTPFKMADGTPARVFSSWDQSTVDTHFRWMKEYGIDGAFMQRFFGVTRTPESRAQGRVILGHALEAADKHGRAVAVMYDLSGLEPGGDCASIIQDWKELVDELRVTSRGDDQPYLYHRGQPLVTIWGVGFPDRPYDIRQIGLEKLLDFLQHDPEYGGCAVMLGVPTYFRTLDRDTTSDAYLHELIERADIVLPWMVGRFNSTAEGEMRRYREQVTGDLAWCSERGVDYVPLVYPGFSWHNLSRHEFKKPAPLGGIPREGGKFYWSLVHGAVDAGGQMLYVAMFDEIDEGTAIFKCSGSPPVGLECLTYEGLPADHYLWLTGQAGEVLRGERKLTRELPER
ncbi:glycoside hydrolase family 71/99-like protein [Aeoliella sp. ICT_H6.2]|uniref:Glycoside hydrolase family 71/99-like protein n=1 Tax=Aeoliella straminimaris TaxID=2954799 RepID=A0A9X2F771_9BACT|nr:glycoside hydrolase family 71/99-like protein [Aeoliella straminimaris]MCO6042948.1 glycoside hydrolase family 71/99-like protein [Aeoliella straminimaris]